ncbi:MAG: amidohydrolase family protein [Deltaproteobacteria bacterium]|nr:amidohydrolase family protein [Deltaproteobacteria bacterium]
MVPLIMHQARWVVPVRGPVLENGAVVVSGEQIVAVGPAVALRRQYACRCCDHGDGAILPALINAHIHLELSALQGRIAPQSSFGHWLEAALAEIACLSPAEMSQGVRLGLAELRRYGTVMAGEVSNTGLSLPLLLESGFEFHYFHECLGFDRLETGPLEADFRIFASPWACTMPNFSAAAHAPYSLSPALFSRILDWNRRYGRRSTVHLAESWEEVQFLSQGNGFFRHLLQHRGRWRADYQPPQCSPVAYLDRLGFLGPETLAVHTVWLDSADREILARRSSWAVLCPRSNQLTGAGFPDLPELHRAGVRLALGTDSLASNQDLNLFNEMLTLHQHYPEFPLDQLLALATQQGAEALGRGDDLGSLASGKKAALLFIPLESESNFWPDLLAAGVAGKISWLGAPGPEGGYGS